MIKTNSCDEESSRNLKGNPLFIIFGMLLSLYCQYNINKLMSYYKQYKSPLPDEDSTLCIVCAFFDKKQQCTAYILDIVPSNISHFYL